PPPPTSTLFPYTTLFRSPRRRSDHGVPRREGRGLRRDRAPDRDAAVLLPPRVPVLGSEGDRGRALHGHGGRADGRPPGARAQSSDRKSTRLNSSHQIISY